MLLLINRKDSNSFSFFYEEEKSWLQKFIIVKPD